MEIISWSIAISTIVWDRAGIELATSGSAVGLAIYLLRYGSGVFKKDKSGFSTIELRLLYMFYCEFGNFREDFIFAKLRICEVSWKQTLAKWLNTLSFIDIGKFCLICGFFTSLMCRENKSLAKIKVSRKFPNLRYSNTACWDPKQKVYYKFGMLYFDLCTIPNGNNGDGWMEAVLVCSLWVL